MEDSKLYVVTDSNILSDRNFYDCIEEALKGGAAMLQLREKNLDGGEFLKKAVTLRKLTKKYGVKFIVNDRLDIALLSDADGVHVGQKDIPAKYIKSIIGEDKIIGVSVRTLDEAKKAKEDGADYIGVGAMFSTNTKLDAKSVEFNVLKEIEKNVDIPIVLIGGLTLDNITKFKDINIYGYAVISSILKKHDIKKECEKWTDKINTLNF